ncbi:MAG: hypothetical protein AAGA92_01925 [Planctomycetota bacterium]
MQMVALLASAVALARQVGYQVREDALDGAGGGHCLIRGKKWLLLDASQPHREQLRDVIDALRAEPALPPGVPAALIREIQGTTQLVQPRAAA